MTFFTRPLTRNPACLALAAFIWGAATTVERLQFRFHRAALRLARGDALRPAEADLVATIGADWLRYALQVAVMGALGGIAVWFIGGWWYRKRLSWCGPPPDLRQARVIYLWTGLVWTLPVLLVATLAPLDAPTPTEAANLGLVAAITHIASYVVSWRAVTTVFVLRPRQAAIWFLALPTIAVLAMIFAARIAAATAA